MALIASRLEIEPEAVPLLVRVTKDKLATLLGRQPDGKQQPIRANAFRNVASALFVGGCPRMNRPWRSTWRERSVLSEHCTSSPLSHHWRTPR